MLRWALSVRKGDARALYMLGNFLAHVRRTDEALTVWKRAAKKLKGFSVVHRNIGRCLWLEKDTPKKAASHYLRAFDAAPWDHKTYIEADELLGQLGRDRDRLRLFRTGGEELASHMEAAQQMTVMLVDLGRYADAIDFMKTHVFKPWEGGRIMYSAHVDAYVGLARKEIAGGNLEAAEDLLRSATDFPENLHIGSSKKLGSAESVYHLALIASKRRRAKEARKLLREAASYHERYPTESTYYSALASRKLGRRKQAQKKLRWIHDEAHHGFVGWSGDTPARREFLKGLALDGMGKKREARAAWRKALKLDAGHRGARLYLEQTG